MQLAFQTRGRTTIIYGALLRLSLLELSLMTAAPQLYII